MVRFEVSSDITERKELELNLEERVKELTCIQQISSAIELENISIDEIIKKSAQALSESFRFPKSTVVRIQIEDNTYETGKIQTCSDKITAQIVVDEKEIGAVEVGYLSEQPQADEGPFLKEERSLINTVAEMLGVFFLVERL